MYVFNKITVNPQLPKRIERIGDIANNLWWSWNTEFLKLFKDIDIDLWESVEKNPTRFLKLVEQDKLERLEKNQAFLKKYDKVVENFDSYMNSKNTWFERTYPNNKSRDLFAYFSAEYGLDEILPIYSGGLGILSGDHLKSASDLGLPFVAVGLLYKNGYFSQKINGNGVQETEYRDIDIDNLPILPVKTEDDKEMKISVDFTGTEVFLKVWQINVGRIKLFLLDSDLKENKPEYRDTTLRLYGGDKEMRIRQEIVLGIGGVKLLKELGFNPTVYHMNEGHSAFATLELIRNKIEEKEISFAMAKDIVSAQTVFTTHTPVPAGNDIFDIHLVEKYFKNYYPKLGISKEDFLRLGMKCETGLEQGFNMGILALKIAGKKNGVSKLHGAVSRELFGEVWSNIASNESPITHVTNGVHTCSWLAPNIKRLFNEYLTPYWQDNIQSNQIWDRIYNIPDEKLWAEHNSRKEKLVNLVKENVTNRLKRAGVSYDEIKDITSKLNPNALTIGFARRFATYKRATLIFKDLERITQILNDESRPVQIIFAGKAHPADKEGQNLIKYIHEISKMPQFKGKIFILENYNIAMARYLVSGVDVWLNNPRRPMEASGTSGQKAAINGVVNFSVLDGWWAEGYNMKNGWSIGTHKEYDSYEEQDIADSNSMYNTLEHKIIPTYYAKDKNGIAKDWMDLMKNSIVSNAGTFSTSRMVAEYVENLYMPLADVTDAYYSNLESVAEYNTWKKEIVRNWNDIVITQKNNINNKKLDARQTIEVECQIKLPNIDKDSITAEVYFGKIQKNGIIENVSIIPMNRVNEDEENKTYTYTAKINLTTGGEFGYTFRVMPKHNMLLDPANLNLVKWITK